MVFCEIQQTKFANPLIILFDHFTKLLSYLEYSATITQN